MSSNFVDFAVLFAFQSCLVDLIAEVTKLTLQEIARSGLIVQQSAALAVAKADIYSNVSYSELARIQMDAIKSKNCYRKFVPGLEEVSADPVLSQPEHEALLTKPCIKPTPAVKKTLKKEGYLCMRMTRYLQRLFDDKDLLLVNSEEYKWIVTFSKHPDNFMKPDFFLIKKGLQIDLGETGSETLVKLRKLPENSDVKYSFGKLNKWCLRDCILAVIEFKVKLEPQDFGKLVCYLQHMSRDDSKSTYRGMVCDATDVWLVCCTEGKVDTRIDTTWTSAGSAQLIKRFFSHRNSWCSVLDYCCAELKVKLSASNSFLGRGSSGRVFRVVDEDNNERAMKIVYSENATHITAVQAEITTLRSIKALGGHTVTVVGEPAYYRNPLNNTITGIGYLMAEVGNVVSVTDHNEQAAELFRELYELHRLNRYHGDPRLPNIIRYNENLLWIDFMRINLDHPSEDEFEKFVEHDVTILLRSVFGEAPPCVVSTLHVYARTRSKANIQNLIQAVNHHKIR